MWGLTPPLPQNILYMKIEKKDLEKSQIEISVEIPVAEFEPYIEKGAVVLSEKIKIEGFRPGKAPLEILRQKVGEMSILEEAAHIAIKKTADGAIEEQVAKRQPVGQPMVNITKLAPGNSFEYKIIVSLLPEIELGAYRDLNIKIAEVKIDKKELDKAKEDLRQARAKEVASKKPAQDGDRVVVDLELFLSKVPVEDGQHKDLELIIGKNYFIPGFDKEIIGLKNEDTKEFSLDYPKEHHQRNLAGKKVDFKVKVKSVHERILPELNDEFAKTFQVKDMSELEKALEGNLLMEKKRKQELRDEGEMINKIVEKTKFGDFPQVLIDNESDNLLAELEESVKRQGGNFEDYLKHIKKSKDELALEMLPNAIKRVKAALIIREIALKEKIEPTTAEIDAKIDLLKKQYQQDAKVMEMLAEPGYRSYLKNILNNEKVIDKLKEWNYASSGNK